MKDSLSLVGSSGNPTEWLLFLRFKFNGTGVYPLETPGQARYVDVLGGDVAINEYRLTPGANSKIEITRYDPLSDKIEGRFFVSLSLSSRYNAAIHPATLIFTEAKFTATIHC